MLVSVSSQSDLLQNRFAVTKPKLNNFNNYLQRHYCLNYFPGVVGQMCGNTSLNDHSASH